MANEFSVNTLKNNDNNKNPKPQGLMKTQWRVLILAAASCSTWNFVLSPDLFALWCYICVQVLALLTGFDISSMPVSLCNVFIFRTAGKQSHMENDTSIYSIWKKSSLY